MSFLSKIKTNIIASEKIYYRGAKSPEVEKGDFPGIWLAENKEVAKQYGKVWTYTVDPTIKLLNTSSAKAKEIEKEFKHKWPNEEQFYNQGGDWQELWMFPPKELIKLLKQYDGYINGSDTFIFNLNKVKPKE